MRMTRAGAGRTAGPSGALPNAAARVLVSLGLSASLLVVPAVGQGSRPLTKTDLIHMLTASNRTGAQIAAVVRRNCLTFQPSNRDLADLRVAGGDSLLFDAIASCAHIPQEIRVVVPRQVLAVAGTEIPVRVQVLRAGRPARGVLVRLRGATTIPGGASQEPGAVTDASGVARPRVLTGLEAGVYRLEVVAEEGASPSAPFELRVSAPQTQLLAALRPGALLVRQGSRSGVTLQAAIQDQSGRPVPGLRLALAGVTARLDSGLVAATNRQGVATFVIPPGAVKRGGQAAVVHAGTRLATFDVRLESVALSGFRTQFVSGTDQRGAVHTSLRQPLVFEVRDTTGRRVAGYPVSFGVVNGMAAPAEGRSDSLGTIRTVLTMGDRTGPVIVTATAGEVRKEVALYATPGRAARLELVRDGRAVDSVLTIATRDSVALRVVARDSFDNEALLEGFQVSVTGRAGAVSLRSLRGGAPPGTVVLDPKRGGAAELAIRASGLALTVPVRVTLPVHGTEWVFAVRGGGTAFSYSYDPPTSTTPVDGRPGFRGELLAGRRVGSTGLRIAAGLGVGVVRAEAGQAHLAVPLLQGLVRGEYALLRERPGGSGVVPVLAAGGGAYRLKSTDPANMVYHTSVFWLVGAGVDWRAGPQLHGEVRLERQQLYEANSGHAGADGGVGALTILEVGLRYSP